MVLSGRAWLASSRSPNLAARRCWSGRGSRWACATCSRWRAASRSAKCGWRARKRIWRARPTAAAAAAPVRRRGAGSGGQRIGIGARVGPAAPAWQAAIDRLAIEDARLLWNDAATKPAAALQLDAVKLQGEKLAWPSKEPMPITLEAELRRQAADAAPAGHLRIEARANEREASGSVALTELALAELAPYVAQALLPRLEGRAA